jgi:hypothetical protein
VPAIVLTLSTTDDDVDEDEDPDDVEGAPIFDGLMVG